MFKAENYRFVKKHCSLCDGIGIIMIPDGMTLEEIRDDGEVPAFDPEVAQKEETCPECDGAGWYWEELED